MLYQKLLIGKNPYFVSVGNGAYFPKHYHPEIELSYCIEGAYEIEVDGKTYSLSSGQLAFVKPMVCHEYPKSDEYSLRLTIELGSGFLGEFFSYFQNADFQTVYLLKQEQEEKKEYDQMIVLLEEIALLQKKQSQSSPLMLKGSLYRLSALMLDCLAKQNLQVAETKRLQNISKIDQAMELIYQSYAQPLSLNEVCEICGYSKSNFCKIFKEVTGDTFHNVLNRYRIEMASLYLKETDISVEGVASEAGFTDVKSFCRVFKKEKGQSPGTYRKQTRISRQKKNSEKKE